MVLTLTAFGWIKRQDVVLALGRSRLTLFWTIAPMSGAFVVCFVAVTLAVVISGSTDAPLPAGLGKTLTHPAIWKHGYIWRSFWHVCVLTPLFEDLLYRGVLAPALERIGGARFAIVGPGLAWACLHVVYGRPIAWSPLYFASGMLGCWIVLRSRSLLPVVVLHALWNAAVPFGYDLIVLHFPELVPTIFGGFAKRSRSARRTGLGRRVVV